MANIFIRATRTIKKSSCVKEIYMKSVKEIRRTVTMTAALTSFPRESNSLKEKEIKFNGGQIRRYNLPHFLLSLTYQIKGEV